MSERQTLLASIAQTIQDYRDGSLLQPIPDHVERWVQQFGADVQLPILREVDHVLKNTYFSKEKVSTFLRTAIRTTKLTGANPKDFWGSANFLDIQGGGDSQTDMLALFSGLLRNEFGVGIEDCGQRNDVFIYLDDGIFTGNRVRRDLEDWVRDVAPAQATVHVICIALHSGGQYYASGKIQGAIKAAGKKIDITWWRAIELEDIIPPRRHLRHHRRRMHRRKVPHGIARGERDVPVVQNKISALRREAQRLNMIP